MPGIQAVPNAEVVVGHEVLSSGLDIDSAAGSKKSHISFLEAKTIRSKPLPE